MLLINVSRIPLEGMELNTSLDPAELHLGGEDGFSLERGTLAGRVERSDDDTVHVRGHLSAEVGVQCGRCLEPFRVPLEQELDLFYLAHRPDLGDEEEDEVELSDRDMVVAYYRDDTLDLGEVLREQLFLALPLARVCREACQGLCRTCGANRNAAACACPPEESESPFSPLRGLFDKGAS
jgi:uncharacterized metal-binding protein YceD (DUF177 family)